MISILVVFGLMFLTIPWGICLKLWDTFPDKTFLLLNASIASILIIGVIIAGALGIKRSERI